MRKKDNAFYRNMQLLKKQSKWWRFRRILIAKRFPGCPLCKAQGYWAEEIAFCLQRYQGDWPWGHRITKRGNVFQRAAQWLTHEHHYYHVLYPCDRGTFYTDWLEIDDRLLFRSSKEPLDVVIVQLMNAEEKE